MQKIYICIKVNLYNTTNLLKFGFYFYNYKLAYLFVASLFTFLINYIVNAQNLAFTNADNYFVPNIPISDNPDKHNMFMNDLEDERLYTSMFSFESTLYGNYIEKNKKLSSKNTTSFYLNNLRYELFSTRQNGDSISLNLDLTYNNDNREFSETFLLNEFSLESKTLRSNLVLGHSYPDFSKFSLSQRVFGIRGSQSFDKTTIDIFSGYKLQNKDDIKKPVQLNGINLKYAIDSAIKAGVRIVSAFDTRNNSPSLSVSNSYKNFPTIKNTVYSVDFLVKNNPNYWIDAEFARSESIFDRRYPSNEFTDTAYRLSGGIIRENWKLESGIDYGGTNFLAYFGDAPRDERRIFGKALYKLNKHFNTQIFAQTSRDNLANYKKDTIIKNLAEFLFSLSPSDYYPNLNFQFLYQPFQEYTDNSKNIKKYRDEIALKSFHKAGEFSYSAYYQFIIFKDKIMKINDIDSNKWELKISWDYNVDNNIYTFFSNEFNYYKISGGKDKIAQFGIGGKSSLKQYLVVAIDYLREINTLKNKNLNSTHNKLILSLVRDYGAYNYFTILLEGNENKFANQNENYNEFSGKISLNKLF